MFTFIELEQKHYIFASRYFKIFSIKKYYKGSCYRESLKIIAKYYAIFLTQSISQKVIIEFINEGNCLIEKYYSKENYIHVLSMFKEFLILANRINLL